MISSIKALSFKHLICFDFCIQNLIFQFHIFRQNNTIITIGSWILSWKKVSFISWGIPMYCITKYMLILNLKAVLPHDCSDNHENNFFSYDPFNYFAKYSFLWGLQLPVMSFFIKLIHIWIVYYETLPVYDA